MKIFLVEDEIVIREGIKNNIPWEKEGFTFAGEASDGELALPMIQKIKPDILITDIKMPFMDGLELSRLVKKEQPEIKIIVLSGYNEFDYAKQAISIGITDYLLKPISSEQLLEAVKEVAKKIEKEKEQAANINQFKKEMLENKKLAKQCFFNDLFYKEYSMSQMLERANELEINMVAESFNTVLFKVMVIDQTGTAYSEEIVKITELLENLVDSNEKIYLFDRAADGWGFLLLDEMADNIELLKEQIFTPLIDTIAQYENLEYFGGIGKSVCRLRELPESFEEANRAFSFRYMGKKNQIIAYNQIDSMNSFMEQDIDLSTLDVGRVDRKILDNFLKSGSMEEIRHFIQDYFLGLGADNVNSLLFRQYIAMDIYFGTVAFIEELGYTTEDIKSSCGEVRGIAGELVTVESTQKYLIRLLESAVSLRNSITMKKYGSLVDDAIAFMKEHFANEDISLNSVAASVNMSPSYFSSIFSQEVGKTFIEYLTNIRMEKAKELLMCTSMKTSEIGFEVGYKEPHYFSYIFKKTQDCSPKEFRTRG